LEPDECVRILQKFRERAHQFFQEAIKEQEHKESHGSIPRSFILLLCLLGFNEFQYVLSWMFSSPITFIFVVFLGIIGYIIYALNLWPIISTVLNPVVTVLQDQFIGKVEQTLQQIFQKARGIKEDETEKKIGNKEKPN